MNSVLSGVFTGPCLDTYDIIDATLVRTLQQELKVFFNINVDLVYDIHMVLLEHGNGTS